MIEPVRSRCLCVRVAAPTYPEVEDMLSHVAKKEGLQLPDSLRERIAKTSDRNLRRALLCFETCKMAQYPFTPDQPVQKTDWELYVQVAPCTKTPACTFSASLKETKCAVTTADCKCFQPVMSVLNTDLHLQQTRLCIGCSQ